MSTRLAYKLHPGGPLLPQGLRAHASASTWPPASQMKGPLCVLNLSFLPEAGGRGGDSLGVPQAEGLDVVRCQGPAHPDLLVPVGGEDVVVIRTHGLCEGGEGTAPLTGQPKPLPSSPSHSDPCPQPPFLFHKDTISTQFLTVTHAFPSPAPMSPSYFTCPHVQPVPRSRIPPLCLCVPTGTHPSTTHGYSLVRTGPLGASGGTDPGSGVGRTPRKCP